LDDLHPAIIFLLRSLVKSSFELVGHMPEESVVDNAPATLAESFDELMQVLWFTSEVYPVVAYTRTSTVLAGSGVTPLA
jgi:hypothetical protein